ncbi:MAG: HsdR family type I site-specific deoxyribonuclease, partial [Nitrososphaeria archaeon]
MPLFSEKSLVEDYIAQKLEKKGWRFVQADELERESFEEPLLVPVLVRALKRLNSSIGVGESEIRQVLNELRFRASGPEHSKQLLNFLKYGVPVKFERDRVVRYVKLFDYDNISGNEFVVSRQVVHRRGEIEIRNDIILYVNGVPVVNVECKNPASLTENWFTAYRQIKEYERSVPELYKYVQIGVAAEAVAKYFTIAPWQEDVRTYGWRSEEESDPLDAIAEMLSPATLLNILRNYLFFRIEYGVSTKVIARYMQYRAAERIFNRVISCIEGRETKNRGLVWHWQGSGKTLTMIFAANKLYHHPLLENPTIFFVVDREELQEQLYTEFAALDITKPEKIESIEMLKQVIRHDDYRGKRGIFITLVHKFRPEELQEVQKELESLSSLRETIRTRRNVILFIDEAHRTQYGILAAQMKEILKNSFSFAFTGTPITKRGRDTYLEFSYPPEETYLDKYFITDSIEDNFTLKIVYQPRLEEKVHLRKELLDTFLQVEFEEVPEEYREKVEEDIRRKLNAIKVFLENPERLRLVAEDIVQHFRENVDGKFKAMIAAVSRTACVRYKRELDRLLPSKYSEIVMTFTNSDPKEIQEYHNELWSRFYGKDDDQIRKEIIEKFKGEDYPKILIVKDMLLTGFDAPILQTLYLDQPLKEHRLLQAVARTNRPYDDVKEAGLIIDYVGILKELTRALENYTKEDVENVLLPVEELAKEFIKILEETTALFEGVPRNQYDRQTMLKAFETITVDEVKTKTFVQNFKKLRKLFELLGTHPIKVEYLEDYKWIVQVYDYYIHWLRQEEYKAYSLVRKYFPRTLKYVYKTTEFSKIRSQYPAIEFDANYLKNLEEKVKSREEKAANIVFTLNRFVLVEKQRNPVYESLSEHVERLLKLWKERVKDYDEIYRQGVFIVNEINRLNERKRQLGLTDLEYGILLTLEGKLGQKDTLVDDSKRLAQELKEKMFPGWQLQTTARKEIEMRIRRF